MTPFSGLRSISNSRFSWICGGLLFSVCLGVGTSDAQQLVLKRPQAPVEEPMCSVLAIPEPVSGEAVPTVESLLTEASRASILGDHETARTLLEQAASIDPRNALIAYRLARTLEDQGATEAAVTEYCRYLSLPGGGANAAAVEERIKDLRDDEGLATAEAWNAAFEEASVAFEAGLYRDAIQAFTRVVELRPELGDGYFNRALAYQADGRSEVAANDFEEYLRLSPDATDRSLVQFEIDRARGVSSSIAVAPAPTPRRIRNFAPGSVLAQGLIIPGLGQHATGRTIMGGLVMAAAGGAVYYALQKDSVTVTKTAQGPFGNPYQYEVRELGRPNQTYGIAAAVGITLLGALESYIYARHSGRLAGGVSEQPSAETEGTGRASLSLNVSEPDRVGFGLRVPIGSTGTKNDR